MIERYSRKVMRDIWTEENKFRAYLEVEILSCEAWSKLGVIPAEDVEIEQAHGLSRAKAGDFSETAADMVEKRLLYPERAVFHKGYFPATFDGCREKTFAFVSVDADLYAPTAAALPLFFARLSPGGVLLVHDVNSTQFSGAGKAVREFCAERGLLPMPVCDLHGSVVLRRSKTA